MTDQSKTGGTDLGIPEYVMEDLDESLVESLAGAAVHDVNDVAVFLSRFTHITSSALITS